MSDEAILAELRAIRDLLIMEGGERVEELADGLGDQHVRLLVELETGEWVSSSDVLSSVAEQFDVSTEAVRQKKDYLLERRFIEQRGQGHGTKYRKTGLGLAAERARQLEGEDS